MPEIPISCPVCQQTVGEPFYSHVDCPVLSNVLCRSPSEAVEAPVGDIALRLCHSCGLIFNSQFDPTRIQYEAEYENALHFSAVFREHEDRLVQRLIDDHRVTNTAVVEIGCGDGHFVSAMCERGNNRGTGFDPAFDFERHQCDLHESVSVHAQEFQAALLADLTPGCICCRHVLEHIPQPAEFLSELRDGLDPAPEAVIYFEVPSSMHSLARRGFWDIIYEHHSYFTAQSLQVLFERCGFEVLEVEETYRGQFLGLYARPASDQRESGLDDTTRDELRSLTERFGADYESEIDRWSQLLKSGDHRQIVAWGAGSKGVTFLNALGNEGRRISAIVDLNPRKHGCYVVRAAQPIVSPSALSQIQPDLVIVMNAAYVDEIASQLEQLGCASQILTLA